MIENVPEWIRKIHETNKNELVIGEDMKVKKLIGLTKNEINYMYVYYCEGKIELWGVLSCIIQLKEVLDNDDYYYMLQHYKVDNIEELLSNKGIVLL